MIIGNIKLWAYFKLRKDLSSDERKVSFGTTIIMRTTTYCLGFPFFWAFFWTFFNQPSKGLVGAYILINEVMDYFSTEFSRIDMRKGSSFRKKSITLHPAWFKLDSVKYDLKD